MKKYLPVVAAVAVLIIFSLSALVFGPRKFAASLPPPFNFITNGGYVSADAGFFGDLTVSGTCTGCGGGGGISNPYLGTFITDAGEVNTLNAETAVTSNGLAADAGNFAVVVSNTLTTNGLIADAGKFNLLTSDAGYFNALQAGTGFLNTISFAGKATGTDPSITVAGDVSRNLAINYPLASSSVPGGLVLTPTNGGMAIVGALGFSTYGAVWLGTAVGSITDTNETLASNGANTNLVAASGGYLSLESGSTVMISISSSGAAIGANGSYVTNVGVGSCVLSGGTCNAVVAGNKGTSLCHAGIQGLYAIDAGGAACHVQADAGSATVVCDYNGLLAYPAAATVGIHCDN